MSQKLITSTVKTNITLSINNICFCFTLLFSYKRVYWSWSWSRIHRVSSNCKACVTRRSGEFDNNQICITNLFNVTQPVTLYMLMSSLDVCGVINSKNYSIFRDLSLRWCDMFMLMF